MTTVVISASNVANFPDGGGHFWVYLQYAHGLQRLGCEVYWLERFTGDPEAPRAQGAIVAFLERAAVFGLGGRVMLYADGRGGAPSAQTHKFIGMSTPRARAILRDAELLLNFQYAIDADLLSLCRRTALVDIDPGLLQFWIAAGQLSVPAHDRYFTTGETVGTPAACFPDCGLPWLRTRPLVCLDLWPATSTTVPDAPFTTISSWWAGGAKGHAEWIVGGDQCYDNCKRVSFLEYLQLPRLTNAKLELALNLSDDEEDRMERRLLEECGWSVRHAREVAGDPEAYRSYIRASRGELSCAKPSCMRFQNAWVSDRTLCYLASGKPVVVQNTGPSAFLPDDEGMFRFTTPEQAVHALERIQSDYARQGAAAREIAETYFDAQPLLARMLDLALC